MCARVCVTFISSFSVFICLFTIIIVGLISKVVLFLFHL